MLLGYTFLNDSLKFYLKITGFIAKYVKDISQSFLLILY